MKILDGYPQSIGAKVEVVVDLEGPTDYTNVFALGQVVEASQFGLRYIEHITGGITDDALYAVHGNIWGVANGEPVTIAYLGWITISTGLEPADHTDLHASSIRLRIVGW